MQNDRQTMKTLAVVIGATGGIGMALKQALIESAGYDSVIGFSRASVPSIELTDEASIKNCALRVAGQGVPRLIIDATGILQTASLKPEKSWHELDAEQMAHAFAVNAIGPALLMKHFLPLLPREGSAVFATLSARVGSIGDNRLGGWYSYRASKAALNQLVRTAAVELARRSPNAVCVALHPGTVDTGLSASFAKTGLDVQTPEIAAERLLRVIHGLTAAESGGFFDYSGAAVAW
jgi:NAD(P)-dependent dehydrogenase (short-subunit alcohol dehydrogenase family)